MYTPNELEQIQNAIDEMIPQHGRSLAHYISPEHKESPQRRIALIEAIKREPGSGAFLPLAVDNPDLLDRIKVDPQVRKYYIYGFLPATAPLVYDNPHEPETQVIDEGRRGNIIHFKHPEGEFIIKPYQSDDERIIAPKAAAIGVGPKQFDSIKNLITEEYVHGTMPTRLKAPELTIDKCYQTGYKIGVIFKKLYHNNIYYNDTISDQTGNSHVICTKDDRVKLLDFGVSLDISNPKNFSDEQIWQILSSEEGITDFVFNGKKTPLELQTKAQHAVDCYRDKIKALTSPEFVSKQLLLIEQSFTTLDRFIGKKFADIMRKGFTEGFKSNISEAPYD